MRTLIVLLALLMAVNAQAAEFKTKREIKKFTASIMAQVADGKTQEGLELMKPYLIIPESEFTVMKEQLKMQEPIIAERFGQTIGVELVTVEAVGDSLMLIIYLQKFEKHIMRWKFYFYKPGSTWVLNTFYTDDKIRLMFEN